MENRVEKFKGNTETIEDYYYCHHGMPYCNHGRLYCNLDNLIVVADKVGRSATPVVLYINGAGNHSSISCMVNLFHKMFTSFVSFTS